MDKRNRDVVRGVLNERREKMTVLKGQIRLMKITFHTFKAATTKRSIGLQTSQTSLPSTDEITNLFDT